MRQSCFPGLLLVAGCLSPFHENERYHDEPQGNLVVRHWEWEQRKFMTDCASGSPTVNGSSHDLLDRNGGVLVRDLHKIWISDKDADLGVVASGELSSPVLSVLDLKSPSVRSSVRLSRQMNFSSASFDRFGDYFEFTCWNFDGKDLPFRLTLKPADHAQLLPLEERGK